MNELEKLLAEEEELKSRIDAARKRRKTEDLKLVRQLCKAHGFTARMLEGYLSEGRKRRTKAEE